MTNFVFRIDSNELFEDPPEIVWSSSDYCWVVNQHLFKTENCNYKPLTTVKKETLAVVIVGFKDFYTKNSYCAQFAAVVDGILSRTRRFSVLTLYNDDAKQVVELLEKYARVPMWAAWYVIGKNEDNKIDVDFLAPSREESEGYFEDKNFDEDLELLSLLAENWAKGKKGLEAGQVFDDWWYYKNVPNIKNTTPNKLS